MPTTNVPQPTQEQLLAVAERVRTAFPHAVNGAELVLIDVDPRHLHAFWTVPFAEAEQVLDRIGGKADSAPMVLRVCPVADDGNALAEAFDIEVLGLQGQFYVDIWDTARRYRATLGYRLADGALVALAASEVAELPSLGPTEDHTWREIALPPPATPVLTPAALTATAPVPAASPTAVTPAAVAAPPGPTLPSRITAIPSSAPPPATGVPPATPAPTALAVTGGPAAAAALAVGEPPRVAAAGKEAAASSDTSLDERVAALSPKSPAQGASMTPAAAADNLDRSHYGTLAPEATDAAPRSVLSAPLGVAPAALAPPSAAPIPVPSPPLTGDQVHPAPFPTSPFGQVGELRPLDDVGAPLRFWEMPPLGDTPAAPSIEAAAADAPALERGSPEPAPPAPQGGSGQHPGRQDGPAALPLPPENVLSLSSFLFGSSDPVELEVNAELHVFGRVKPGSRLLLFGRPVSIRPDGTFSIHRPLGTGAAIMPVLLTEEDEAKPEDRGEPTSGETE